MLGSPGMGTEDCNYRAVPVGACYFKGRHINEQVWNHLVTMLIECGILQVAAEESIFNPDVNVDEYEIIGREFLHTYTLDQIHSWHKVAGCTFDQNGSNFLLHSKRVFLCLQCL